MSGELGFALVTVPNLFMTNLLAERLPNSASRVFCGSHNRSSAGTVYPSRSPGLIRWYNAQPSRVLEFYVALKRSQLLLLPKLAIHKSSSLLATP
ncbi:hypothetical protein PoB_003974900 [Plakobranchus ocellatus]|uniref:Uncharacterized protein n=1 Tax=Plakobranchus ocellatus TaxID=259542 RepID=A0AAV4B4D6_9GAST|nr:hypothetical protein PoB_003974900 [Plakobranchus ocellatus]